MTDTPMTAAADAVARRHAALVAATREAIDALPPLAPDASPQSFPALKAATPPEVRA